MKNFDFHLGTRIHFGKGILKNISDEILRYGNSVFFVYDEIPAKATGAYDLIHKICQEKGITITDFTGIEPNPKHSTIDKAVSLLKKVNSKCIVALGGGSTIDSAKAISFTYYHDGSCWDFFAKGRL